MTTKNKLAKEMYSKSFKKLDKDKKEIVLKAANLKKVTKDQFAAISNGAFVFCRYSVAILVWLGFLLKLKWLILLTFLILLFSAILTVKRAPMILLYNYTLGKIIPSKKETLNIKAMRFAHILGSIFSGVAVIFLYLIHDFTGWVIVGIFVIIKTISAIGFCPASKLYNCMANGSCCAFAKRR